MDDATTLRPDEHRPTRWWQVVGSLPMAVTVIVAIEAVFILLVAFGNITDYGTNFAFVQHVLAMDSIFPNSTIAWRAIANPALQHFGYAMIITAEVVTAILCWIGAAALLRKLSASAVSFNRAKSYAIAGLTLGFLLWQVGFMTIGGEWFGMWMSKQWNGVPDASRFFTTLLLVLVYVSLANDQLQD